MSPILTEFVETLHPKAAGIIKGTARLDITGEGSVFLDDTGASLSDAEADVALKASEAVFRAILSGDQNPMTAYMTGKLKVDGNAMRALKISELLTA
ncbi:SCP2 sterol-binding domain-containing protein [Algirhabdus cladophorae]|uniref:SCP2 sterol-binding domain-containing protein n=1 Tax=Algirhabdus cladophorae TaxID=3377108 RepID=UPI003B846E29